MSKNKSKSGNVRIIAGKWRSRKLTFPSHPDLRPTTDRIRETVFNWLTPHIVDAVCLDLFAGSGALSFEALSRGAKFAVALDQAKDVIAAIKKNAELFNTQDIAAYQTKLPSQSNVLTDYTFDIIFLDPPFRQNLIRPCCEWLEKNINLAPQALLYIEAEANLDPLPLSSHWEIIRSKKTGEIGYHLAKFLDKNTN